MIADDLKFVWDWGFLPFMYHLNCFGSVWTGRVYRKSVI